MESTNQRMQRFLDSGVMAIVRIDTPKDVIPAVQALADGGIQLIEISLVTPKAVEYISLVHEQLGKEVLIGAGTVLDVASARTAILAGADFLVTPVLKVEVAEIARRYGKLSFIGAYSPSECLAAYEAGADAVKIFPAMPAGPKYFKAIHAPLPQIPLVAVGGVTQENLPDFFKAGAVGVAGASNLADPKLIRSGEFAKVTKTAASWLEAARVARG